MPWFKSPASTQSNIKSNDTIVPTTLSVTYDKTIFRNKMQLLLNQVDEKGGIDVFIEALRNKQALFNKVLNAQVIECLDAAAVEALLDTVFTARRKLPMVLPDVAFSELAASIKYLMYGEADLAERMNSFVNLLASDNRKIKRAAWDFAAEMLHFTTPDKYPHMAKWVWNADDLGGAYREFIAGSDSLSDIPIGSKPGDFEATRLWFADQLDELGFYRDIHFLIDLLIAQAYADYILSMSKGMGMFSSQFGGTETEPLEFIIKLLGIDPPRKKGLTRLKKSVAH